MENLGIVICYPISGGSNGKEHGNMKLKLGIYSGLKGFGFPNIRCMFWGAPIIRIIVSGGVFLRKIPTRAILLLGGNPHITPKPGKPACDPRRSRS